MIRQTRTSKLGAIWTVKQVYVIKMHDFSIFVLCPLDHEGDHKLFYIITPSHPGHRGDGRRERRDDVAEAADSAEYADDSEGQHRPAARHKGVRKRSSSRDRHKNGSEVRIG